MRIAPFYTSPLFWIASLIGTFILIVFNAHPLELTRYFAYGWAGIREIPLDEFDVWLGIVFALLGGWNVGGLTYLGTRHAFTAGRSSGVLSTLGATTGYFALYCAACQSTLLTIFGVSIAAELVAPYLPILKFASTTLLLVATIMLTKKLHSPAVCSPSLHRKKSQK